MILGTSHIRRAQTGRGFPKSVKPQVVQVKSWIKYENAKYAPALGALTLTLPRRNSSEGVCNPEITEKHLELCPIQLTG